MEATVRNTVEEFEVDAEKLVEALGQPSNVDEYYRWLDIKNRRLVLDVGVDQMSVSDVVGHIIRYNREDKGIPVEIRKPIILYIVSPGGDVLSGFELIDIVEYSKTPIYTVNFGYQYSMALPIGLAGKKRYALPNASFLIHDGYIGVNDSSSKAQDWAEFLRRLDKREKEYILSKTKITEEQFSAKERVDWYFFVEDAKAMGIVDYIVGIDCDLDEIL